MPKPYEMVIWDWNGTLTNDAGLCREIMNGMLAKRGLPPLSGRRYQEIMDFPVITYYQRAGWDFAKEPFAQVATEFIDLFSRRWPECSLRPGARRVLAAIDRAGIEQAVLSAAPQDYLEHALAHYGINHFFVRRAGLSDHYGGEKLETGRRLLAETGAVPGRTILIGDTAHDYQVADSLGLDCLLLLGGHCARHRLEACGCPILRSPAAVLPLLDLE